MPRELVVELIKKRKAIHQEKHDLVIEELSVEEELVYCTLNNEANLEAKLREIKVKQFSVNAQLDRAYVFGPCYTHGAIPSLCAICFVDHNKESFMVEVESDRGHGIRQFECPTCKYVLRVDPI